MNKRKKKEKKKQETGEIPINKINDIDETKYDLKMKCTNHTESIINNWLTVYAYVCVCATVFMVLQ